MQNAIHGTVCMDKHQVWILLHLWGRMHHVAAMLMPVIIMASTDGSELFSEKIQA